MKCVRYVSILFSLSFILTSCYKNNNSRQESIQLRAYRLIDDNRVDDAISLLSEEIEQNESTETSGTLPTQEIDRLKITLASAYAKKAGISIREIVKSIQAGKKISAIEIIKSNKESSSPSELQLIKLSKLLKNMLKGAQTLMIIPKINPENEIYLSMAVKVINSISQRETSDYVYSSIIKLIFVKSMIESERFKHFASQIIMKNQKCMIQINELNQQILKFSKILMSGYEDWAQASPKQSREANKNIKAISDLTQEILTYHSNIILIDSLGAKENLEALYQFLGIETPIESCKID